MFEVKFISLEQVVDRTAQIEMGVVRNTFHAVDIIKELTNIHKKSEEYTYVLALDVKNQVLGITQLSKGTLNSASIHPRELFKFLVSVNAQSFIMAHNHPSGMAQPSTEDCILTKHIVEVTKLIGIQLLDHLIITDVEFYSMKEHGFI